MRRTSLPRRLRLRLLKVWVFNTGGHMNKKEIKAVLDQETFLFDDGTVESYATCPKCFELIPEKGNETRCGQCGQDIAWVSRKG